MESPPTDRDSEAGDPAAEGCTPGGQPGEDAHEGGDDHAGTSGSWAYRRAKRIVVTVVGVTVMLFGVLLLVFPGPGWAVIFAGLGILAIEFEWARRLLRRAKDGGKVLWQKMRWKSR